MLYLKTLTCYALCSNVSNRSKQQVNNQLMLLVYKALVSKYNVYILYIGLLVLLLLLWLMALIPC